MPNCNYIKDPNYEPKKLTHNTTTTSKIQETTRKESNPRVTHENGDRLGVGAPHGLRVLALPLHRVRVPRVFPQPNLMLRLQSKRSRDQNRIKEGDKEGENGGGGGEQPGRRSIARGAWGRRRGGGGWWPSRRRPGRRRLRRRRGRRGRDRGGSPAATRRPCTSSSISISISIFGGGRGRGGGRRRE